MSPICTAASGCSNSLRHATQLWGSSGGGSSGGVRSGGGSRSSSSSSSGSSGGGGGHRVLVRGKCRRKSGTPVTGVAFAGHDDGLGPPVHVLFRLPNVHAPARETEGLEA